MDFKNIIKDCIQGKLIHLTNQEKYKIWGYPIKTNDTANSEPAKIIIPTGQIITLNGQNFMVIESQYDAETMNNLKSFEATCVKIN